MKNLLVTGGCGFIGANFIRYLFSDTRYSGRIINVDKLTYAGNPENLKGIEQKYPKRYYFVKADICDAKAMSAVFKKYEIDAVCHFAAESHVDRSIVTPNTFIKTNIEGTFNLLEQARSCQDRLVLFHHISTDEVFGSLGPDGYFTEETCYDPSSPYSASKAASDHLVRAYSRTYGLPVTISNCSNNYGPYQFPEKLIPLMTLNALDGKSLPVYGEGKNIRDWLYVKDHCKAVWAIMKKGKRGQTYNIGGNCEICNIDVVNQLCDMLDVIKVDMAGKPRRRLIRFVKDRPGHDLRYAMDFSKLKNELGWQPDESFATGIEKTVKWYLNNTGWVERVKSGEYLKWIDQQYE
ncbi:MAG: dTDP-glucose 4,6-dehydratase [Thermodesulfobacteriota bacterium]|nr:dTDP-glucose 4,6-dehydratase [Thermodesulfobacteriota bacterium]